MIVPLIRMSVRPHLYLFRGVWMCATFKGAALEISSGNSIGLAYLNWLHRWGDRYWEMK